MSRIADTQRATMGGTMARRRKRAARVVTGTGVLLALLLSAACGGLLPAASPPPQGFDFGPLPAPVADARYARRLTLTAVRAPTWLDGNDIHYRLLHEQPGARRAYANSVWVAPPAELMAHRLRHLLAGGTTAADSAQLGLRVDLQVFEQVFDGPDRATVRAQALATLTTRDGERSERVFVLQRDSTPDVGGATRGLAVLAEGLARDIVEWAGVAAGAP